ncbi:MAG: hypothetical protein ABEI58_04065 [Candidatus Nanohaloarchaea archaeon]
MKIRYNRKGIKAMNFLIGLIIGVLLLLVLTPIAVDVVSGSQEATEGCSVMASVISDMFSGAIQLC